MKSLFPFLTVLLLARGPFLPAAEKPLRVFILAGQSNMQGHARVSTLDTLALDPETAPILAKIRDEKGQDRVLEDVWIASLGSSDEEKTGRLTTGFGAGGRGPKIGPELTFGIYARELLGGPILIIKTAWGGKSLHTDFRPPGAGPYVFNDTQIEQLQKQGKNLEEAKKERAEATGHYYRLMMEYVRRVLGDIRRVVPGHDPDRGHVLSGFVWFQGWNDMVDRGVYPDRGEPGGYDAYSRVLGQFIRDVRKDLDAPELPFVIGVMGTEGPVKLYGPDQKRYAAIHQNFRDAMAAPASWPEFRGNVVAVLTENYWDQEVVRLRRKEKTIRPRVQEIREKMKQKALSRQEGEKALAALDEETFTPRELKILRESVSNANYHYMGSGKVMAGIGKGFAEAVARLVSKKGS